MHLLASVLDVGQCFGACVPRSRWGNPRHRDFLLQLQVQHRYPRSQSTSLQLLLLRGQELNRAAPLVGSQVCRPSQSGAAAVAAVIDVARGIIGVTAIVLIGCYDRVSGLPVRGSRHAMSKPFCVSQFAAQ